MLSSRLAVPTNHIFFGIFIFNKVDQFIKAPVSSFVLRSAKLPEVKISLGGHSAYGVIFWDGGTFSTMEPVFTPVKLAPGAKADFIMNWNF